ncbi:MAG: ATP-binding cassette domain-containing protein [Chitinophagales bacterium]
MITIQNLHFSYKKKPIFKGLSLQLQPGHIYGLLGKNGTGKSTLLRNIVGLLFPDKGKIEVLGFVPGLRQPAFLQQVFLVPEEFYLPDVPLQHLVDHHAPFYPQFDTKRFGKYIQEFDVPSDTTLQKMSYGQKKKVLISFGLATSAPMLLMDEPTNGLDIMSKSQFRKVMAAELNDQKCIVISTHQVKDLENLIDRVTIIDEGKILFDQTVDAICRKLSFRISFDQDEVKQSLYSESSLRGNTIITPNTHGEESKLDLELLYKAIVMNGHLIQSVFTA